MSSSLLLLEKYKSLIMHTLEFLGGKPMTTTKSLKIFAKGHLICREIMNGRSLSRATPDSLTLRHHYEMLKILNIRASITLLLPISGPAFWNGKVNTSRAIRQGGKNTISAYAYDDLGRLTHHLGMFCRQPIFMSSDRQIELVRSIPSCRCVCATKGLDHTPSRVLRLTSSS